MTASIHLDGREIDSEAKFHAALRVGTGVEWYGGNLDALFDLLVAAAPDPVHIRWTDAALSRAAIGERFDRLIGVIFDAIDDTSRERVSLHLES